MTEETKLDRREWLKLTGVGIAGLAIGGGIGYYAGLSSVPKAVVKGPTAGIAKKKTLRAGIGVDADTLDPVSQHTTMIANVVDLMIDPLFYQDENGDLIPWLAESYNVSPDGLKYTIKIRKGVYFQDGNKLDANAVKFTFERALNPKVRVPLRNYFGTLKEANVIDDYTLELTLSAPFAPFLRGLSSTMSGIISPAACNKLGDKGMTNTPYNIGTGPFKFKEWVKGDRIVFERNEKYWLGAPKVNEIIFKIASDPHTREAMLLSGDLDMIVLPPPPDIESLSKRSNIIVKAVQSTRYMFMYINTQKDPFKDKRVRKALNYAIDKESIIKDVLLSLAKMADSVMPSTFFGYFPQKVYEYNPDKAKKLLADAGYPNGFECTLYTPTGRYLFDRQVAEATQSYLSKVGIKAKIMTPDWPTYIATLLKPLKENPIELALLGWGPWVLDADFMLYPLFHSSLWPPKGFNVSFYKNPTVDDLIIKARESTSPSDRLKLYKQIEGIIWDDAPIIFLYVQKYIISYADNVLGIKMLPIEKFELRDVTLV